MVSEKIGFPEAFSMSVGGMIGGGIFAVLGVVVVNAGPAAWMAFAVSGVVTLCAGYSFVRLNGLVDGGNPVGFLEEVIGDRRVAGMVGWIFVFGYIGTMAMYAYAFGGYFVELAGIARLAGAPARPIVSVAAVASFVGLNALGARASGRAEDVLVAAKVLILLVFAGGGIYYGYTHDALRTGFSVLGVGPLVAAAISFVAFEGWELLFFDQDSIEDPIETVRKAVYSSVVFTTFVYILVAVVTSNLVDPQRIQQHPETALAVAAEPFLGSLGFTLISVAALFSTGSAMNATLFSSARLLGKMSTHSGSDEGVSREFGLIYRLEHIDIDETTRELLVLGALTAVFTAYGSLSGITSFASGAFVTIFGFVSYVAFREREGVVTGVIPAVGMLGSAATVVALNWHLYTREPQVFGTVIVIWIVVVALYWLPKPK